MKMITNKKSFFTWNGLSTWDLQAQFHIICKFPCIIKYEKDSSNGFHHKLRKSVIHKIIHSMKIWILNSKSETAIKYTVFDRLTMHIENHCDKIVPKNSISHCQTMMEDRIQLQNFDVCIYFFFPFVISLGLMRVSHQDLNIYVWETYWNACQLK